MIITIRYTSDGIAALRKESDGFIVEFRKLNGITTFAKWFDFTDFMPCVFYFFQHSDLYQER